MSFTLYTIESAPEEVQEELKKSHQAFGMVPNLHAVLAEAPVVLESYKHLHAQFLASSLSDAEKTVVWQTINLKNECHYCVPAHTAIAYSMKIDEDLIQALKSGDTLGDSKLEVLRQTTLALLENRGFLSESQKQAFFDAGYGNQQLLEIVLGLAQKTISNYTNHLADTPLDEPFKKFA